MEKEVCVICEQNEKQKHISPFCLLEMKVIHLRIILSDIIKCFVFMLRIRNDKRKKKNNFLNLMKKGSLCL